MKKEIFVMYLKRAKFAGVLCPPEFYFYYSFTYLKQINIFFLVGGGDAVALITLSLPDKDLGKNKDLL